MTDHIEHTEQSRRLRLHLPAKLAVIGAGLLALGGAAGAIVMAETRPTVSMAPATPVAIRSLSSTGIVTIRGRVAEVYGNKFVMADGSGRALVDTGREGDERALVTANEVVTVQGRFDRGFVRAAFLVKADRKVIVLGPLAGPPEPHGPAGPRGRPDHGPDSPPPGADRPAPAPARSAPTVDADGAAATPPAPVTGGMQ
ncbi:hypothetical protein [Sphingomonas montana]|uniref:hypothetical protein n=1 Tax=Sphingomonas montana TaxID=1843236 RepID=UPI00096C347A|nr:hypothetical protein [Sphingomonas montana]